MTPVTTLTNPVVFGGQTADEDAVKFPLGKKIAGTNGHKLGDLLRDGDILKKLKTSRVFIFGKVGFFDLIFSKLHEIHPDQFPEKPLLLRTTTDLKRHTSRGSKKAAALDTNDLPTILMPATESPESTNKLIAQALEFNQPLWLVALPSQVQRQLLLSFNCFFVASGPDQEVDILMNITPLVDADIKKLESKSDVQALFASDCKLSTLGESPRLGTVIHIHSFD